MIYSDDGSRVLTNFIPPQFLLALLQARAFHLVRLDQQRGDPDDGKLPPACFDQPYRGAVEDALRIPDRILKSHARTFESDRIRTFIMSWTIDPSEHMQAEYGKHGQRCRLQISESRLKASLGFERKQECEFPPRRRPVPEIRGADTTVELFEANYTTNTEAIPVVPSPFAAAHKREQYRDEAEIRIQAVLRPHDIPVPPKVTVIRWPILSFAGLGISIGAKVDSDLADKIRVEAEGVGLVVHLPT